MSASISSALNSQYAAPFFRSTPEGSVFTRPSPWPYGRGRDYRVTDAQVGQLVARIGRAQTILSVVQTVASLSVLAIIVFAIMKATNWSALGLSLDHPVASAVVAILLIVLAIPANAITYWVAGPPIAGLSGTSTSGEPATAVETRSTPFLMLMVLLWLAAAVVFGIDAAKDLRSGILNLDAYMTVFFLGWCGQAAAALVTKLKGQQSGGVSGPQSRDASVG